MLCVWKLNLDVFLLINLVDSGWTTGQVTVLTVVCVCASFPVSCTLVVSYSFTVVCLIASFLVILRPMYSWCAQEVLCGRSHATVFGKPKRSHEVRLDKCYYYHVWTTVVDVHKKFGSFGETENQTRRFLYLQYIDRSRMSENRSFKKPNRNFGLHQMLKSTPNSSSLSFSGGTWFWTKFNIEWAHLWWGFNKCEWAHLWLGLESAV